MLAGMIVNLLLLLFSVSHKGVNWDRADRVTGGVNWDKRIG